MSFWRRNRTARNRRKEPRSWMLALPVIPWRRLAPAGAVLATAAGLLFTVRLMLDQPVERVSISGRFQRVQALDVEKAVRGAVAQQGLASVDLDMIAQAVQQIPWVDRASVARSWPRAVHVQVVEQVPVARWGRNGLLNTRGEVFVHDSRHLPAELPQLDGPEGFHIEMTEYYLAAQPRLAQAGMRLTRMKLDERGAWELSLDNGVTLRLGRQQVTERFDRFIAAAARIVAARAADISYVDLRYANGFAIGWRSGRGEVKSG